MHLLPRHCPWRCSRNRSCKGLNTQHCDADALAHLAGGLQSRRSRPSTARRDHRPGESTLGCLVIVRGSPMRAFWLLTMTRDPVSPELITASFTTGLALQGQHRQQSEVGQGAGSRDEASTRACGHGERGAQPQVRLGIARTAAPWSRLAYLRAITIIATAQVQFAGTTSPVVASPNQYRQRHLGLVKEHVYGQVLMQQGVDVLVVSSSAGLSGASVCQGRCYDPPLALSLTKTPQGTMTLQRAPAFDSTCFTCPSPIT